jgi:hypothetical protein
MRKHGCSRATAYRKAKAMAISRNRRRQIERVRAKRGPGYYWSPIGERLLDRLHELEKQSDDLYRAALHVLAGEQDKAELIAKTITRLTSTLAGYLEHVGLTVADAMEIERGLGFKTLQEELRRRREQSLA